MIFMWKSPVTITGDFRTSPVAITSVSIQVQVTKSKYRSVSIQVQVYRCKYTSASKQAQISKFKWASASIETILRKNASQCFRKKWKTNNKLYINSKKIKKEEDSSMCLGDLGHGLVETLCGGDMCITKLLSSPKVCKEIINNKNIQKSFIPCDFQTRSGTCPVLQSLRNPGYPWTW